MMKRLTSDVLLFQTIKLLIIFSPLEHVIGVEKIFYLTGILIALFAILAKRKLYINNTFSIIFFIMYAAATCYWSKNEAPFLNLFNTAVMYFFLFLILQHKYSKQEYEQLRVAFVLQGVVLLILCFLFGEYQDNRFWIISSTTGADPNYLSGWFILPIALTTQYLLKKKNIVLRIFFFVEIALSLYFIAESGSRSGLLCNAFVMVCTAVYLLRNEIRKKPIYGVGGLVAFVVACYWGLQMIPAYTLYRFIGASDAGSLGGRTNIWSNLITALLDNPAGLLFGMGQGSAPLYSGFDRVAHNTFLDILFENGLLGLGLYLYFYISFLKKALTNDFTVGISMVAVSILIFTLSSTYMRFLIFMLFMSACSPEMKYDTVPKEQPVYE